MGQKGSTTGAKPSEPKQKTAAVEEEEKKQQIEAAFSLFDKYSTPVDPPSKIRDFLFLGSYDHVWDLPHKLEDKKKELQELKVGYIVTCAKECQIMFPNDFQYLKLDLVDDVSPTTMAILETQLEETCKFIDSARKSEDGRTVLVHCWQGVSRSATIVIAFLMYSEGLSLDEAHKQVKASRSMIAPNPAFKHFLKDLPSRSWMQSSSNL
jgi:protein-tyrosine phosphatase